MHRSSPLGPLVAALALVLAASGQERVPIVLEPAPAPEVPEPSEPSFELPVLFRVQGPGAPSRNPRGEREEPPPVAGALVALGLGRTKDPLRWIDEPVLVRATSDERGLVHATLHVPERLRDDPDARAWARVETPGHARGAAARSFGAAPDEPSRIRDRPGTTVLGTVRDAKGEPVADAEVWAFAPGTPRSVERDEARSAADGRFVLDVEAAGPLVLHARASGVGSGRTGLARVAADERPALTVGGGVALAGRVLDGNGAPVAGLRIVALPAGYERFPPRDARIENETEGGLFGDVARTDLDGRFELPLVAGDYELHWSWFYERENGMGRRFVGEPWTSIRAAPDAEPLELRFPRHRIEVALVGGSGPAVDVRDTLRNRDPDEPILALHALRNGAPDPSAPSLDVTTVGGRVAWLVEADRDYLVAYQDPARGVVERVVPVRWDRELERVELRLPPPAAPAELTVRVLDPDGSAHAGDAQVVVRTAGGHEIASSVGFTGLSRASAMDGSSWRTQLPRGRFVVEANAEPVMGCVVPPTLPRAELAPGRTGIELLAGEARTVEVRLGPAGHLDFEGAGKDVGQAIYDASHTWHSPSGATVEPDAARTTLHGAAVTLHRANGESLERLVFELPDADLDWIDWLLPGVSARCLTPIPPGTWTLRVANESGVLDEREVVIEAGRTTVVRW